MRNLLLLFILFPIHAFTADIPGYYISDTGDTSRVTFKIPLLLNKEISFFRLHWKVKYYDVNHQLIKLNPVHVSQIAFNYAGEEIKMTCKKNNLFNGQPINDKDFKSIPDKRKYIFLQLIIDGRLKLYNFYDNYTSVGSAPRKLKSVDGVAKYSYKEGGFLLELEPGRLMQSFSVRTIPRTWSILYYMVNITHNLNDCPEIYSMLNQKPKNRDIVAIVNYFNAHCNKTDIAK